MPELSRSYCRKALIPPCVLAAFAWTLAPAHAQTLAADTTSSSTTSSGQGIQEIQVTAERRSTDLQKTPLAITTITPETLDKTNITDLAGLNGTVPGLEITKSAGFENIVTIRGVGIETPENAPITVPGVALFVDGVYIANTVSLDQTLFDLDHIEVLRGPQGALYGQSATGGAISMVTKQPALNEVSGSGDVSYGNYNLHRERAELNAPIGSTVAVRASVQQFQHDGFTTNTTLNTKLDDANDVSGKFAVLWQPVDTFQATLTGQWYSADQNGAAQKNVNDPSGDPRVVSQDFASKFNLDTQLYHLNMQWDLPWFSVKSVSAFQGLDHRQKEDSSRSTYALLKSYDDVAAWNTSLQNYSEELDLLSTPNSRLDWITGVFLQSQHAAQFVVEYEGTDANPNLSIPGNVMSHPPSNLAYGNYTYVERKSYSPFVQGTYHLTDAWRVTLGARYNYDSYHLNSDNFSAFSISNVTNHSSNRAPTGRFEIDYDLTPKNMVYASVSRGYKPGGVNGNGTKAIVPDKFKQETNTAYEIGSKNTFFDNRIRANVAAFYYVYKNMQYIETDPVPFAAAVSNIPSTHIWGGELETSYHALQDRLKIGANLTVEEGSVQGDYSSLDSTVQQKIESTNPACAFGGAYYSKACWAAVIAGATNIKGNEPAKMPTVSGSINASYDFAVKTGTLTPRIEYVYRGDMWARIFNVSSLDQVKAYGIVNLNLQYAPNESNFTLSLAATNVTNVAGVNSRYTDPYGTFQTSQQYIPPMQVVGTVAYNF